MVTEAPSKVLVTGPITESERGINSALKTFSSISSGIIVLDTARETLDTVSVTDNVIYPLPPSLPSVEFNAGFWHPESISIHAPAKTRAPEINFTKTDFPVFIHFSLIVVDKDYSSS
jgi:hypothetical protein